MVVSYYMDSEKRIMSICNDDLTGTSDWYRGEIGLTVNDNLTDDHGAFLYKLENGIAVERAIEERMADWPEEPEPEATLEDYAEALSRLGVTV